MNLMASNNNRHPKRSPPDLSPPVAESQKMSGQLRPLVDSLNEIVDRLEHLAGMDDQEGDQPDDHPDP